MVEVTYANQFPAVGGEELVAMINVHLETGASWGETELNFADPGLYLNVPYVLFIYQ